MRDRRGHPRSLSGYERVETPLYCVLTRVELRHAWALPAMWRIYRRVRNEARRVAGLKRCAFLVAGLRTFVILSIWDDEAGFLDFGTRVEQHLGAARRSLSNAGRGANGPRIWSTEWQIRAVSHNLGWGERDDWIGLRPHPSEPVPTAVAGSRGAG